MKIKTNYYVAKFDETKLNEKDDSAVLFIKYFDTKEELRNELNKQKKEIEKDVSKPYSIDYGVNHIEYDDYFKVVGTFNNHNKYHKSFEF